ncbi:LLM class flavin-dependent oxidoreductase [Aureimonas ureilytica]|uniref:LLM class flavin-dependent oxidoreductase n=1 Tax=Aureimonas ureilytica TaxID=401562 RepID=UPI0003622CFF|nr:LLM class flavin-dependent oxidoreductase [Aureimonas ureilytica]
MTSLNPLDRRGRFKLGIFAANCSNGMSVTKVPERWDASWESNLSLARMTDEAGLDFLLPIARWIGYGGRDINFQKDVLETTTWAAGLLASTRRIAVISTVHTAANNPVVVAKQIATLDAIGNGRAGLNVVAGWNAPEYAALGLDLPASHVERYAYAQEWLDVIGRLWETEGSFDFDGRFFQLRGVHSDPKPKRGRVPIVNAAGSGEGRGFAVRNADFLFTPAIDLSRSGAEIAELKAAGREAGRDVEVLTFSHVVCRPSESEAKAYYDHCLAQTDWEATDNLVNLQFAHAHSFPHDLLALIRERMAAGHGGFPLTGTPDQVADGIEALVEAGFGGTTLSFVNYAEEFPYFRDEVLPRLEERGLRSAQPDAVVQAAE